MGLHSCLNASLQGTELRVLGRSAHRRLPVTTEFSRRLKLSNDICIQNYRR